jgi:hypothetical protein
MNPCSNVVYAFAGAPRLNATILTAAATSGLASQAEA